MGLRLIVVLCLLAIFSVTAASAFSGSAADGSVASDGDKITVSFDARGRPVAFEANLPRRCSWGEGDRVMTWWPSDGSPVRFEWEGDRLRVEETVEDDYDHGWRGRSVYTLDARLEGRVLSGTIHLRETFWQLGERDQRCDSDLIRFSVSR